MSDSPFSSNFTASAFTGLSDFFTCLKLHFLIATKFFINTYLNYQTLVLFLVAKTSADNLSQGFRTELPLTYRLPSPRPPLTISFFLMLTTSLLLVWPRKKHPCSCLLIHRAAARRRFLFKSCSFVSGWRLTEHQRQIPQLRLSRERER